MNQHQEGVGWREALKSECFTPELRTQCMCVVIYSQRNMFCTAAQSPGILTFTNRIYHHQVTPLANYFTIHTHPWDLHDSMRHLDLVATGIRSRSNIRSSFAFSMASVTFSLTFLPASGLVNQVAGSCSFLLLHIRYNRCEQ